MLFILLTWLFAPLWAGLARWRRLRYPTPQRILVLEIAGIGDVVCSTAVFRALRARYPQAQNSLLVESFSRDIVANDPHLDQVLAIPAKQLRGLTGRLALTRIMRGYDTVICLNPGAAQLCAMCWAGAPRRFSVLPPSPKRSYQVLRPLLSGSQCHNQSANFVQTQLKLLQQLDIHSIDVRKSLSIPAATQNRIDALLPPGQLVGIAIGSGLTLKEIPEPLLLSAIRFLQSQIGITIILIGGAKEKSKANRLLAALADPHHVLDLTACLSLPESAAVLARLALFIGVNSGITHMADGLGTPIICLSGPSDIVEQGPNGPHVTILRRKPPCCPCDSVFSTPSSCRISTRECIADIQPDELVATIRSHLQNAH